MNRRLSLRVLSPLSMRPCRMGFGCSCLFVLALLSYTRGQPSSGAPQLLLQGRFYPGAQSAGIASLPQTFS